MRIPEKRGLLYRVGPVVLLTTMLATVVESKWEEQEPLLAYLAESGMINHEMAELLKTDCMLEFLHIKKTLHDLELDFRERKSTDNNEFKRLSGTKMHDAIDVLLPQVNQMLVESVRRKNLMLHPSGEEEDSDTWYTRYLGFLFNQHWSSTRRVLAQTSRVAPAPSPAVSSPTPFPTVSSPAPAPSDSPPPATIPASPPLVRFSSPDFNNPSLHPTDVDHGADGQSSNQKASKKPVVIAVVVTAAVTSVTAALLFLLWCRCCRTGFRQGRNDDRPLLSLSLRDHSIASSHKSFGPGTSLNEEKLGNQSFCYKLNRNKVSGDFYKESHSLGNSETEIPVGSTTGQACSSVGNSLQMPHGMLDAPKLPPLKPPPARTDPAKPPPRSATPPTPAPASPPPPPPPPPKKPSSGGPRPQTPPPPPPPPMPYAGPHPPPPPPLPPPSSGVPPPQPSPIGIKNPRPVPPGPCHPSNSMSIEESKAGATKAKLKPFFWDKVLANPDHSMVWHQIKSGSFQFNEEMIENLFGYVPAGKTKNEVKNESSSQDVVSQYIQIIDPKKSQNLSILLKALHVTTDEVCDAIEEGNELPSELIQTLLKMAPTAEEEKKLRYYSGELSLLGPADRFLKVLVDIPFAFERLESLLFMCTLQEEISTLKESFAVLEAACSELRKSRLFLKLLEAVLKTGNRLNNGTFHGGAQAFKLDTLLKLSDVKGTDGKTTLLHFVVQEIIRSEGERAARVAKETSSSKSSLNSDDLPEHSIQDSDENLRSIGLQAVSGLVNELGNVKKAAILDADSLTGTVAKLGTALVKAQDFLNSDMKNLAKENGFRQTLERFVQNAEVDVTWSLEEEKRIMALVKSTADYFHGSSGKDEGLRLFIIVRDFLIILDKVCKEVKTTSQKPSRTSRKEDTAVIPYRSTAACSRGCSTVVVPSHH